jgi:hypothetical protein
MHKVILAGLLGLGLANMSLAQLPTDNFPDNAASSRIRIDMQNPNGNPADFYIITISKEILADVQEEEAPQEEDAMVLAQESRGGGVGANFASDHDALNVAKEVKLKEAVGKKTITRPIAQVSARNINGGFAIPYASNFPGLTMRLADGKLVAGRGLFNYLQKSNMELSVHLGRELGIKPDEQIFIVLRKKNR